MTKNKNQRGNFTMKIKRTINILTLIALTFTITACSSPRETCKQAVDSLIGQVGCNILPE